LTLSDISLQREPEPELVSRFARTVGTPQRLALLYALTVLDIRHAGAHAWTGWKAAQLERIYALTEAELGASPGVAQRLSAPADALDTLSSEFSGHQAALQALVLGVREGEIVLRTIAFRDFHRVTVLTRDRPHLLADLVGCLTGAGLDIASARVSSLPGNVAVDSFDVFADPSTSQPISERISRIEGLWSKIRDRSESAASIVSDRLRRYPPKPRRARAREALVTVSNDLSPRFTVVQVQAPDSVGLLHRFVHALSSLDLNIASAKISTRFDTALDIFYVTDRALCKVTDSSRIESIRADLTAIAGRTGQT
jgi:[protein-PII] uridylyltransferase